MVLPFYVTISITPSTSDGDLQKGVLQNLQYHDRHNVNPGSYNFVTGYIHKQIVGIWT